MNGYIMGNMIIVIVIRQIDNIVRYSSIFCKSSQGLSSLFFVLKTSIASFRVVYDS